MQFLLLLRVPTAQWHLSLVLFPASSNLEPAESSLLSSQVNFERLPFFLNPFSVRPRSPRRPRWASNNFASPSNRHLSRPPSSLFVLRLLNLFICSPIYGATNPSNLYPPNESATSLLAIDTSPSRSLVTSLSILHAFSPAPAGSASSISAHDKNPSISQQSWASYNSRLSVQRNPQAWQQRTPFLVLASGTINITPSPRLASLHQRHTSSTKQQERQFCDGTIDGSQTKQTTPIATTATTTIADWEGSVFTHTHTRGLLGRETRRALIKRPSLPTSVKLCCAALSWCWRVLSFWLAAEPGTALEGKRAERFGIAD